MMEDQDIASPTRGLHGHQRMDRGWCDRHRGWQNSGIVVLENICLLVIVVLVPAQPLVAGTQIAGRVILWATVVLGFVVLAIPGAFGAMR